MKLPISIQSPKVPVAKMSKANTEQKCEGHSLDRVRNTRKTPIHSKGALRLLVGAVKAHATRLMPTGKGV